MGGDYHRVATAVDGEIYIKSPPSSSPPSPPSHHPSFPEGWLLSQGAWRHRDELRGGLAGSDVGTGALLLLLLLSLTHIQQLDASLWKRAGRHKVAWHGTPGALCCPLSSSEQAYKSLCQFQSFGPSRRHRSGLGWELLRLVIATRYLKNSMRVGCRPDQSASITLKPHFQLNFFFLHYYYYF